MKLSNKQTRAIIREARLVAPHILKTYDAAIEGGWWDGWNPRDSGWLDPIEPIISYLISHAEHAAKSLDDECMLDTCRSAGLRATVERVHCYPKSNLRITFGTDLYSFTV